MEAGTSSIKKIVWQGEGKYLKMLAEKEEGNDLAQSVEISEKKVLNIQKWGWTISFIFYTLRLQFKGLREDKEFY